ncbi:MAG: hypothetical protein HYS12_07110 [Planctomycetes bacterium]|nr:hypothetical protein [Planctomycetota bacterium]
MPSWLLASPVPPSPALWTEAEWEQAIFKADDETLNVLKTWLRHAPELPWSGPAWEDETPQTRRLLIYMYGEDQVEVGDLVDAVWGKDTSEGAIQTAISKANNCLRREKYPRILTKVKAAAIIRWE